MKQLVCIMKKTSQKQPMIDKAINAGGARDPLTYAKTLPDTNS